MKSIILCFALLAVLASSNLTDSSKPDMIIEFFRHGARAPVYTYDPTWNVWDYGVLTPVGLRQHYILGKVLAEKYPYLVGSTYNYSEMSVLSDVTPRCIQSAGAHLYGMYMGTGPSLPNDYPPELAVPPFKDARVDSIADSLPDYEALPYNFIPGIVEIVDATTGIIFSGDEGVYCPNQAIWENQNQNDSVAQQGFEVFGPTIAAINELLSSDLQLTNPINISGFGDTMLADLYANRTLPANLSDPALVTNMTWAFTYFTFHWWMGQQIQKETGAFNVIETFLQQLGEFRNGTTTNKVNLYSGHDGNIFVVLAAFGLINEQCILDNFYSVLANGTLVHPLCYYPYFASNLIIEFYNDTETPSVKLFYNNDIVPICNGQESCSYDEFTTFAKSSVGNLTLDSYLKTCGANTTYLHEVLGLYNLTNVTETIESVMLKKSTSVTNEILAVVALAVLCFMLTAKMVFDKKKHTEEIKAVRAKNMLYGKLTSIEA